MIGTTRRCNPAARLVAALFATLLLAIAPARAEAPWQTLPTPPPMPKLTQQGWIDHDGARIWYGALGKGAPVILLHGGLGSSEDWSFQVPALVASGRKVVLIDSRGQGRSVFHGALHYADMAGDVIAVLDAMKLRRVSIVGWSDGAIVSLILAMDHSDRLDHVYAFGANMDLKGLKPDGGTSPIIPKIEAISRASYARIAPQGDYDAMSKAVFAMQDAEPNFTAVDLAAIKGPRIAISDGAHDEFIKRSHSEYLAHTIPGAQLIILPQVSHFAMWQRPELFNRSVLAFLNSP